MKKFGIQVIVLVGLVALLFVICDMAYSIVYRNCQPRNKLEYILHIQDKHFDVVFLGSSRVANHIDAQLFEKLSGKKTINLGVEGAGLNDNLLQLQLLLEHNTVNQVFLQVDTNLESTEPSNISTAEAMPFIKNNIVRAHTKKYNPNYHALFYIPFYRYAVNDSKIGFRELFFSMINKKPGTDPSIGFVPKYGNTIPNEKRTSMDTKGLFVKNSILSQIRTLCKLHHTELVLFIAPYCSKIDVKSYVEKIQTMEPGLIDLTKGYDDSLFFNCGHLNDKGAKLLTQRLFEVSNK
jgi:hypothetical protein